MSLSAHHLSATRADRVLFAALDVQLAPGQALWLRGRNGAGKTTLLRLLAGLGQPAEGVVRWQGQDIRRLREDYARELLWMGHANGLKDDLSALENLAFAQHLRGWPADSSALREALAQVGLAREARRPAGLLSQGQRRRVALARLYLRPAPALWLLDEPFTALDAPAITQLNTRLARHLADGGLLVYTTHQPQDLGMAHAVQTLDLSPTGSAPHTGPSTRVALATSC
jgi:heme exporter protein A